MSILIENISKEFGEKTVLDSINLEIKTGSLVALLGGSGSGKSTLLRIVAGFEAPDNGRVWLHGKDASTLAIQEKEIGFVFQAYALFQHLTVYENIAFGLSDNDSFLQLKSSHAKGLVGVYNNYLPWGVKPTRFSSLIGPLVNKKFSDSKTATTDLVKKQKTIPGQKILDEHSRSLSINVNDLRLNQSPSTGVLLKANQKPVENKKKSSAGTSLLATGFAHSAYCPPSAQEAEQATQIDTQSKGLPSFASILALPLSSLALPKAPVANQKASTAVLLAKQKQEQSAQQLLPSTSKIEAPPKSVAELGSGGASLNKQHHYSHQSQSNSLAPLAMCEASSKHSNCLLCEASTANSQHSKQSKAKAAKVEELLRLVQLEELANRYPSQLSGGQCQRVALARALAVQPKVLLLDEPFGALDMKVRKQLRRWLRQLHERVGVTTLFVTHDHQEAMEVANEIVVLDKGRVKHSLQSPQKIYELLRKKSF